MALLHRAELRPSKTEFLAAWAPSQPWFTGEVGSELTKVASFRFDDPDGQVGVETLLVRAGDGPVMQIPLTYRNAPLTGGDAWLIGTLHHSVLGTRWVYDAVGDPVYLLTTATATITGGRQADLYVDVDGELVPREPSAVVAGSGTADATVPTAPSVADISVRFEGGSTVVEATGLVLAVACVLRADAPELRWPASLAGTNAAEGVLTGTWTGQPERVPLVLAAVR
jgi:hypothetical protein